MFNDNEKRQYKNIKAPESLKSAIFNDIKDIEPTRKNNTVKYIRVAAACLVALLCIVLAGAGVSSSTIYVNGEAYYEDSLTISSASPVMAVSRLTEVQVVEINAFLPVQIAVDNGSFTIFDARTGEQLYNGNKYSASGRVLIQMDLPQGEEATLSLKSLFAEKELYLKSTEA